MEAIILAGGLGSRLKPYTMSIPKPLLPVGDMPIIEVLLTQLANKGFTKIYICLGHMAPIFQTYLGDGSKFGLSIEYIFEDVPLGTAGALRMINTTAAHVLIMNGDLLTNFDFMEFFNQHLQKKAAASIGVSVRKVFIDYGVVKTDGDSFLEGFDEKPTHQYNVSMGINIIKSEMIRFIPENIKFDMPDFLLKIKSEGENVFCYKTDCYWQDIGRFDDYQKASADFVENPEYFLAK
jgi:NDP-sugar pyrophosphorylase family protein